MPHFLPLLSNLPFVTVLQVKVMVSLFKKKGSSIVLVSSFNFKSFIAENRTTFG